MMHNGGLDELFFITQFIKGLKPEISSVVQSQVPASMDRAVLLAKIQQVLDKGKSKWQKSSSWAKSNSQQTKTEVKGNAPTTTLWKERQVRDYRKNNGLCFYCGEQYDAQHKNTCTKRPQPQTHVNALVVNDLDVVLTDEVLNQLAVEDALAEDFCQLSLNAIAGTDHGDALRLRALVQNKVMLILVDSGSSHSFVSKQFLETVGHSSIPTTPVSVKLANGDRMISDHWVSRMEWWINGHTLSSDMKVLEMGAYDAILGYDWLKANSPMICHWTDKTLQFSLAGTEITLQGIKATAPQLQETSVEQLFKWSL